MGPKKRIPLRKKISLIPAVSHHGEGVVEVVAALSRGQLVRPRRLHRRDGRVVRLVAEHVRGRVDQPASSQCFITFSGL